LAKNDKNGSILCHYTDCWHVYLSGGLNVVFNVTNMESRRESPTGQRNSVYC